MKHCPERLLNLKKEEQTNLDDNICEINPKDLR